MEELMYALREDWGPEGATDFLETITENRIHPDIM